MRLQIENPWKSQLHDFVLRQEELVSVTASLVKKREPVHLAISNQCG